LHIKIGNHRHHGLFASSPLSIQKYDDSRVDVLGPSLLSALTVKNVPKIIHVLEPSLLSPLSDLENLAGEHACSSSFPVSQKAEERLAMTLCNSSKHQDRGLMDVGSLEVYKSLLLGLLLLFYHFLALYLTFRKTRAKKLMVSGSPALLPKIKKSEQSDTCFRTLFPPPSHTKVRQPNTHVFCLLSSPLLSKKKDHRNELCSRRSVLRLSNLTIYLAYPKPRLLDRMPSASPPPYFSGIQINGEEEQCSGSCSSDFQKTTVRLSMSWGRPGFQINKTISIMIFSSSLS
jgi:hypothetical protein